jgi:DnaJ like chaperone protein
MIFGKLLGAMIGYNWFNIPGAVLGLFMGHQFDKALTGNMSSPGTGNQAQIQQSFFRMTFLAMGKLAKADGQVSKDEIEWAEFVMSRMNLTADMRQQAMALFSEGKSDGFDLDSELVGFRQIVGRHATVVQMFLEIQVQAAYADGSLSQPEHALLRHVCAQIGITDMRFEIIHQRIKAERAFAGQGGYQQGASRPQYAPADKLKEAYKVIGVEESASDAVMKKAYRRLMSQHHPDKLVAKGLPEEMMRIAKEKTQEIHAAYDLIKQHRKG